MGAIKLYGSLVCQYRNDCAVATAKVGNSSSSPAHPASQAGQFINGNKQYSNKKKPKMVPTHVQCATKMSVMCCEVTNEGIPLLPSSFPKLKKNMDK